MESGYPKEEIVSLIEISRYYRKLESLEKPIEEEGDITLGETIFSEKDLELNIHDQKMRNVSILF